MIAACKTCILEKSLVHYPEDAPASQIEQYQNKVRAIVRDFPDDGTGPELAWEIKQIRKEIFKVKPADFTGIKKHYNQLLLSMEDALKEKIRKAPDPLLSAVRYAMTGNYIDYSALKTVEDAVLLALLDKADAAVPDPETYAHLRASIQSAKKMVYLTDNCGEILLDKLLIEEMLRMNPALSVTVLVRGSSEGNDATMTDAEEVGLTSVCRVAGNGAPLDATVLKCLSAEARSLMSEADFIMAKGQANYESLHGSGLPIYFLFMCKCDFFTSRFQVPKYGVILTGGGNEYET